MRDKQTANNTNAPLPLADSSIPCSEIEPASAGSLPVVHGFRQVGEIGAASVEAGDDISNGQVLNDLGWGQHVWRSTSLIA